MNPRSPSARKPQRALRERIKALAHDTILDAAEAVFAERGLAAPMEAIALRAGVAVGTLYNHFDSRDALFEALLAERRQKLLDAMLEGSRAAQHLPFAKRLHATLTSLVAAMAQQTEFRRLIVQADLPLRRSSREAITTKLLSGMEDLFAQGHKEKVLADDPHRLQPALLFGLLQTALSVSLRAPDRLPLDRVPDVVTEQFLHGATGPEKRR